MKGTCFQRPLEFKIDVQGETWNQGESISGTLTVKNHGSSQVQTQGMRVSLARGQLKKVHAKAPDAFEVLASSELPENGRIDAQKDLNFPWSFQTRRDCPITDVSSSLFLLYGTAEAPGQLQLTFQPDPIIQEFVQRFEIGFRFVKKSAKSAKSSVEVKFDPPDARGFASVEQLVLSFEFEGETLAVKYAFAVKQLEASAAAMNLKKGKKTFEQSFGPQDYKTPSGRFNYERIEAAIREVIAQVESKTL
jgi:hypothetical protein